MSKRDVRRRKEAHLVETGPIRAEDKKPVQREYVTKSHREILPVPLIEKPSTTSQEYFCTSCGESIGSESADVCSDCEEYYGNPDLCPEEYCNCCGEELGPESGGFCICECEDQVLDDMRED